MKSFLGILLAIVLVGAGYGVYEKYFSFNAAQVEGQVLKELGAVEEYVFSQDNLKFTDTTQDKQFLAHIDYRYTWEAAVPFGFTPEDMVLNVDKKTRVVKVQIKSVRLKEFEVQNQQDEVTSVFAWLNQGDPAKKFWEGIEDRTKTKIIEHYQKEPDQVGQIADITEKALAERLEAIIEKLPDDGVTFDIELGELELYDEQKVPLTKSEA